MSAYETMIVIGISLWIPIALALLACLVYVIGVLRSVREPVRRIATSAEDLQERLKPVLRNVERTSEDATYIAASLRADADDLGEALQHAAESTHEMLDLAEERVAEVAALLSVVQEEAEETFLSTASLLRGLRGGRGKESAVRRIGRTIGLGGR